MTEALEQTVERYLQRWRPTLRPASMSNKQAALKKLTTYLREHHPEVRQFSQVKRYPHIEGLLEYLLYLKPSSRITVLRNLRLFFEDLLQWGWLQPPARNPISHQDFPPEPMTLPRPLPPDVDHALQEVLWKTYTFSAMAMLLLRQTGMRLGEMRALSVNALEGSEDEGYRLRVPIGKTHTERIIPLCAETVRLVQDILAQRGAKKPVPSRYARFLMVNELGRHLRPQSYGYQLKRLTADIDTTEAIYPHRLRHTFATEMSRAGMPVPVLMKLLGHRTPKMTMRYVEVAHIDLKNAYDHALDQLTTMQTLDLPALPTESSSPDTILPDDLPLIMEALMARLEKERREARHSDRERKLLRFIQRMRRASDDLKRWI